jgi:hypothetical protein
MRKMIDGKSSLESVGAAGVVIWKLQASIWNEGIDLSVPEFLPRTSLPAI